MSVLLRNKSMLFCAVFLLAGCATVTRGTTNQVQINSEPAGADVRTSLNHNCTTPCTITVNRKEEFTVTISKAGYQPESVFVKTAVAGSGAAGFVGNVVAGGIVGMGVDAATGSTLEHLPNPVSIILKPAAGSKRTPAPKASSKAKPAPQAAIPEPVGPTISRAGVSPEGAGLLGTGALMPPVR